MKASSIFLGQDKVFWANVKSISEAQGYTDRTTKKIKKLDVAGIQESFKKMNLLPDKLVDEGILTEYGSRVVDYFNYRSDILENHVKNSLMNESDAALLCMDMIDKFPDRKIPYVWNKQKGEKKKISYLTCMVNIIMEKEFGLNGFDPDPRSLTVFTSDKGLLRTLSRRVDGAFPCVVNPVAIWEIKEYYYTTTFGSRVADGVYETLLDGLELEELRINENRKCDHVLIIDSYNTWWEQGKSYLCRMIDMLHMGMVNNIIFGREIKTELPLLAMEWKSLIEQR